MRSCRVCSGECNRNCLKWAGTGKFLALHTPSTFSHYRFGGEEREREGGGGAEHTRQESQAKSNRDAPPQSKFTTQNTVLRIPVLKLVFLLFVLLVPFLLPFVLSFSNSAPHYLDILSVHYSVLSPFAFVLLLPTFDNPLKAPCVSYFQMNKQINMFFLEIFEHPCLFFRKAFTQPSLIFFHICDNRSPTEI